MAGDVAADLALTPVGASSQTRTIRQWLTTFHLVVVALDPYSPESAWLLPSVARILRVYDDADCRVGMLVGADQSDTKAFLGPYAKEFLTFADPDRSAIKGLGIEYLPALVHVRQDLSVAGIAEGWHPPEWRVITDNLSLIMRWSRPVIPGPRDPAPYDGSPAFG